MSKRKARHIDVGRPELGRVPGTRSVETVGGMWLVRPSLNKMRKGPLPMVRLHDSGEGLVMYSDVAHSAFAFRDEEELPAWKRLTRVRPSLRTPSGLEVSLPRDCNATQLHRRALQEADRYLGALGITWNVEEHGRVSPSSTVLSAVIDPASPPLELSYQIDLTQPFETVVTPRQVAAGALRAVVDYTRLRALEAVAG